MNFLNGNKPHKSECYKKRETAHYSNGWDGMVKCWCWIVRSQRRPSSTLIMMCILSCVFSVKEKRASGRLQLQLIFSLYSFLSTRQ